MMAPSSGRMDSDLMTYLANILMVLQIHMGSVTFASSRNIPPGSHFAMLSKDNPLIVMNAGQTVSLGCEFYMENYKMFDNPVVWTKRQFHEEMPINIMGNINPPFVHTKRFRSEFNPQVPRFNLLLTIQNLTQEDSGNYSCEVRGKETTTLGSNTHTLFVRASVHDVVLSNMNCTSNCAHGTPSRITFRENQKGRLQCVATGGNPPPTLRIFRNHENDITFLFEESRYTTLLGELGLRLMHHTVHALSKHPNLRFTADNNGDNFTCVASINGFADNVTSTEIHVQYAPIITCEKKLVDLTEWPKRRQMTVSCTIRADPPTTAFYWSVEDNGTTLDVMESGNVYKGNYWTLSEYHENRREKVVSLYMHHVTKAIFRHYTLVAENMISIAQGRAEIREVKHSTTLELGNTDDSVPHYDTIYTNNAEHTFISVTGNMAPHLATIHVTIILTFHSIYLIFSVSGS